MCMRWHAGTMGEQRQTSRLRGNVALCCASACTPSASLARHASGRGLRANWRTNAQAPAHPAHPAGDLGVPAQGLGAQLRAQGWVMGGGAAAPPCQPTPTAGLRGQATTSCADAGKAATHTAAITTSCMQVHAGAFFTSAQTQAAASPPPSAPGYSHSPPPPSPAPSPGPPSPPGTPRSVCDEGRPQLCTAVADVPPGQSAGSVGHGGGGGVAACGRLLCVCPHPTPPATRGLSMQAAP